MDPHHETGFPTTLCRWVGEIVQSSPEAARLTLLEVIVGALLASGGHVTQAILVLTPRLGWQAYHWMLERGRFRLLGLISALCRIVRREIGVRRCFVVIDATLAPRGSAQPPGVAGGFDHRPNARRSCCPSVSSRSSCHVGIARCRWSPACAAVRATPASPRSPRACCAPSAPSWPGQSGEARIFLIQDDNLTAEVPLRRSILQSTLRQKYRSTGRHNPQRDGGPEKGLYRLHPIALGHVNEALPRRHIREV